VGVVLSCEVRQGDCVRLKVRIRVGNEFRGMIFM